MRRYLIALFIIAGCVALAFYALALRPVAPMASACTSSDILGGSFSLIDQDGQHVTNDTYKGKYRLVVFGFTFCPDICPLQLANASAALDKLDRKMDRIKPIFISLDPARDTPNVIKDYLKTYPLFTGLTGSEDEIAAVAKSYKIFYEKVPNKEMPDAYTIDHSVRIFLMDPDGKFVEMYDNPSVGLLAAKIDACVN